MANASPENPSLKKLSFRVMLPAAAAGFSVLVTLGAIAALYAEGAARGEGLRLDGAFWALLAVHLAATGGATFVAALFGRWVLQSSRRIQTLAESMGPGRELADIGDLGVAEFRRTKNAISRAARRYTAELERLRDQAFVDPATGLPNAMRLSDEIEKRVLAQTGGQTFAYMHVSLDGYETAAETLGGRLSRELIEAAASRVGSVVETHAELSAHDKRDFLIASIYGGVFGLALPRGSGREEASALARRLRTAFETPFLVDGRTVKLGLSGGIVLAPDDGETADDLMRRAEFTTGQVYSAGRLGFQFYAPKLDRLTQSRFRLEADLREAVQAGDFRPVFQPKISFETGRIVGCEALARWNRGEGRAISPAAFIPIAEETGLICDIGAQVLEKSCAHAAEWLRAGHDVSVAVNVSPKQFERDDFIDTVLDSLRTAGLPPRLLELEITETVAVSNPGRVGEVMRPLRAMGVKLAVDDFGTGHANLSILTQLPFDTFKIDRQFISALEAGEQGPAIVEMILAMAKTLGLRTVAEGVETKAQAEFLRERGCTLAQGYLYSAGVHPDEFKTLLDTWAPVVFETPADPVRRAS